MLCGANMDLRQLEIIKAIAESGSFTSAGEKLGVSQSAISRQVLALERELREAVFLRVGRSVRITSAGEELLRLSQRMFQDLNETVERITDYDRPLTGSLRLAGGMTVSLYVFPVLLREFRRAHPLVDVKITAGSSDKCCAMVRSGTADLGLVTMPLDEPDLVVTPALEEELLLVTALSHPLARKRRIQPSDLRGEPFVLFEAGSNSRRIVDDFLHREQIEPSVVTDSENVELLKNLARAGLGVTVVPYQAVARETSGGQLFCSRIHGVSLIRRTAWVHAKASRAPRAVQEMLRTLERIKPRLRLAPQTRAKPAADAEPAPSRAPV
jgi:DNA-binding transcriptional LysR family regulator